MTHGYPARETGSVVFPLDTSELEESYRLQLNALVEPETPFTKVDITLEGGPGELALAHDRNGHAWLVCTEGVASPINATGIKVALWGSSGNTFSMFPHADVHWTYERIQALASDEPVDLSEWVRTFGARLEDNFRSLREQLGDNAEATA